MNFSFPGFGGGLPGGSGVIVGDPSDDFNPSISATPSYGLPPLPTPSSNPGLGRNDPRLSPGEKLDAGSTLVHLLDKDEFERVFVELGIPFLVALLGAAILLGSFCGCRHWNPACVLQVIISEVADFQSGILLAVSICCI
jgi:hypothetical protein